MNKIAIQDIKSKASESVKMWAEERIDDLVAANPKLTVASVYLKRGIGNWLSRENGRIDEVIDRAAMFICDENGEVNMETLFNDLMSVFKTMEETPFEYGFLKGTIGQGVIRLALPDNPFMSLLFGNTGALKITETDFVELKSLFVEEA